MIRNGTHAVTQRANVVVECDTPGCPEALYMPPEMTREKAPLHLRRIGWAVEDVMPEWKDRPARCPAHAGPARPLPNLPSLPLWARRYGRKRAQAALEGRDIAGVVQALADGCRIPNEDEEGGAWASRS